MNWTPGVVATEKFHISDFTIYAELHALIMYMTVTLPV